MIFDDGLKAEASGVWPPAVEHPAGPAPTIALTAEHRELRVGRIALFSALTGIGLPALMVGVLMLLLRQVNSATLKIDNILSDAWLIICLLGVACEVAAVITGGIARRTRDGQWGMAIPLLTLAVTVVLVLLQHHTNGTWPWEGFQDDCGCDGSG